MNQSPDISKLDAIVLAGGESKRMGVAKATLPFGDTSLVGSAVAALRPVFRRVLVVTRDKDSLAGIDAEVLEDEWPQQGPLVGLARGLAHSDADWCFVTACDMPFLQVAVIKEMAKRLTGCDAVIPEYEGRLQTLHAFYSRACLPIAQGLLEEGTTSMRALVSGCRITKFFQDDFAHIPDGLRSFRDVDTAEEYRAALNDPPES
ncbi:MAG: molybdenum cofactor guanylyltransferase [SAR202 cluster bacterium]|nr:molybdenum cofactor guanylyltransferase [SAR202 cluster bacterium]